MWTSSVCEDEGPLAFVRIYERENVCSPQSAQSAKWDHRQPNYIERCHNRATAENLRLILQNAVFLCVYQRTVLYFTVCCKRCMEC